jgi:predicted NAD/FAD-dependent oxidoreductase
MANNEAEAELLGEPIRAQLRDWFGRQVDAWLPLAQTFVPEALPQQLPGEFQPASRRYQLAPGLFRCGDYLGTASINGALLSGREAASELVRALPV